MKQQIQRIFQLKSLLGYKLKYPQHDVKHEVIMKRSSLQRAQQKVEIEPTLQVYYNSACPICEKGIEWQKQKMTCEVLWKNIHDNHLFVNEINKELHFVRKYLHIMKNGQVYIGFEACITLWENSETEVWKAKLFSLPVIKPIGIYLYIAFANVLYVWNRLCRRW